MWEVVLNPVQVGHHLPEIETILKASHIVDRMMLEIIEDFTLSGNTPSLSLASASLKSLFKELRTSHGDAGDWEDAELHFDEERRVVPTWQSLRSRAQ